jgi:hypothetical protein
MPMLRRPVGGEMTFGLFLPEEAKLGPVPCAVVFVRSDLYP